MVHLMETATEVEMEAGGDPDNVDLDSMPHKEIGNGERHFCEKCADKFFAGTPGMNSARHLICLSDAYRSRLLDKVEAELPEAFYEGDDLKRERTVSEKMTQFLRRELEREGIPIEGDAFVMLWADLFCGAAFYERRDKYNRENGG